MYDLGTKIFLIVQQVLILLFLEWNAQNVTYTHMLNLLEKSQLIQAEFGQAKIQRSLSLGLSSLNRKTVYLVYDSAE